MYTYTLHLPGSQSAGLAFVKRSGTFECSHLDQNIKKESFLNHNDNNQFSQAFVLLLLLLIVDELTRHLRATPSETFYDYFKLLPYDLESSDVRRPGMFHLIQSLEDLVTNIPPHLLGLTCHIYLMS